MTFSPAQIEAAARALSPFVAVHCAPNLVNTIATEQARLALSAVQPSEGEGRPCFALRGNDPDDGELDDVVVERPQMFRVEMVSESELRMACHFDTGRHLLFWVTAREGRIVFNATDVPEHVDWDEREALVPQEQAK